MYSSLRTLARRARFAVAECNYAQRRLAELQASLDRYVIQPVQAPDTYQAFLSRTSRTLVHEPSSAQRSAGESVR